jgi:Tol biopolymer transport system component
MFKKSVGNAPPGPLLILGAAIVFAATTARPEAEEAAENERAPASGAYVAPFPESTDEAGVPRLENCIAYEYGRMKVITLDGKQSRDLNEKVYDYILVGWPVLSPDGTKVAFQVTVDCHWDICISNLDGSAEKNVTDFFAEDLWPAFSPDGTKIVFASDRNAEDGREYYDIYIMNVDGSAVTRLTKNRGSNAWPAFSPDGKKIAFTRNRSDEDGIYVMNADGSGRTRLTHNPAWDENPVFSPDGKKIAFVSERDGEKEIYLMNADGSDQGRLTYGGGGAPCFSPMRVDGVLLDTYGRVMEE